MKINNREFDVLNLYVKKDQAEKIIENYKIFGYEISEKIENKKYEDIYDLTLIRKHKIKNKDELQLLQVYMEENLNEQAKITKNKYSKTTIFALCFGVFGLIFIILGILNLINIFNFLNIISEIIILSFGGLCFLLGIIIIPKIYKNEKIDFCQNKKRLEKQLQIICEKATSLTGEENESI